MEKSYRNFYRTTIGKSLLVRGVISDSVESGPFQFYDNGTENIPCQAGVFVNGFRDGDWIYTADSLVYKLEWLTMKDSILGYETNILDYVDTLIKADSAKIYTYKIGQLKFELVFYRSKTLSSRIRAEGYINLSSNELKALDLGLQIDELDSVILEKTNYERKIYTMRLKGTEINDYYYLFLANHISNEDAFIVIVRSAEKSELLRHIFQSVIGNVKLDGSRIIYPYSRSTRS
jgi:hypothetical protein